MSNDSHLRGIKGFAFVVVFRRDFYRSWRANLGFLYLKFRRILIFLDKSNTEAGIFDWFSPVNPIV